MDEAEAVRYLVGRLPEFEQVAGEHIQAYDEPLLHVLMGDLGRFYMERARLDPELTSRYWQAVEVLATDGDAGVKNAVAASLMEWFAWGDVSEKAALRDAMNDLGPNTREAGRSYLDDL